MRAVLQRVSRATVAVEGRTVGAIEGGLLVLLGVAKGDGDRDVRWLSEKIANLRIFPDEQDAMNRSVLETGGRCLVVSQFTLHADCRKGRRPSFVAAARPDEAEPLYERFCEALGALGIAVERGVFGAHMDVSLTNDGPVTVILDSPGYDAAGVPRA
jgi:D-tyrosyl-tRNA(Tyr) deacylase